MNRTRKIDDVQTWEIAKAYLQEHGFKPWQYQYDIDSPEGFHAVFSNWRDGDIEIITFNEAIYQAIIKYK